MNKQAMLELQLSAKNSKERIKALTELMSLYNSGEIKKPSSTNFVNNHIHTTFSFSPYTPTSAAYTAWKSGLQTAGIMDHDSIAGAKEFIQAGEIIGIATTIGFEIRCSMNDTPFYGKRINNPDQDSVAYLAAHGIPHQNIDKVQQWLEPYRKNREIRNEKMTENIAKLLKDTQVTLDYKKDVRPLSNAEIGGSVTERHILFALANKITSHCGRGGQTLKFLKETFNIDVKGKILSQLEDTDNPYYEYYLLGVLKSSLVEQFYIDATDECPHVSEFISFVREIGAIPAYAYLGDVAQSPTGDKKAQTFEDSYLGELVEWLSETDFAAITFMASRNTTEQAYRITSLAEKYELFQISGEDINTPFQSFICKDLEKEEFKHLIPATWALIGHEKAATKNIDDGMFSSKTIESFPVLQERIDYFQAIGRAKI